MLVFLTFFYLMISYDQSETYPQIIYRVYLYRIFKKYQPTNEVLENGLSFSY